MRRPSPQDHPPRAAVMGTRAQLLEAAAREFAARGFRAATVRGICRRAGANVAAVRYHFGGKDRLYAAVLHETGHAAGTAAGATAALRNVPPAGQLEEFVRSLLQRILSGGPGALHGQILSREMIEPTPALDGVVKNFMRPQSEWLAGIIRGLMGPGLQPAQARRLGLSVVSQILFYKHCRPVLDRLYPDEPPAGSQIEELTQHITSFSLAALRGLAAERQRERRKGGSAAGRQTPEKSKRQAAADPADSGDSRSSRGHASVDSRSSSLQKAVLRRTVIHTT